MKDDLISRQAVIDLIMGDGLYCDTYSDKVYSAERIKALPAADLSEYCDKLWKIAYERGKAEAHPRTGKWIKKVGEMVDTYVCDQCGRKNGVAKTRYCPNCGAKMEESDG